MRADRSTGEAPRRARPCATVTVTRAGPTGRTAPAEARRRVIVTIRPPLRNTTRSTPISASHWRQPPHGDAVVAATRKSPGRYPSAIGAREGGALGADAERIRGVLDVAALDDMPVAREHGAPDVEARVRRIRVRRGGVGAGEELLVGDRHAAEKTWKMASVTSAPISPRPRPRRWSARRTRHGFAPRAVP